MLQRDKIRYFYYNKNDINIEKDFGGIDMALTAVKSANAYKALCRVLERNEIIHECDEKNWCVKCSVSGNETDFQFAFVIEPSKMLIKLYVFLDIDLSQASISELSFALCVINDSLSDGHFCFDRSGTSLYFKITASFYNSFTDESVFEYLLSAAAESTEEYYSKIKGITEKIQAYKIMDRNLY